MRASERLWQDYRLARKARRRRQTAHPWLFRLVFLLAAAMVMLRGRRSPEFIIALLALWAAGTYFLRASQLTAALYLSVRLNVFQHLPVSDDDIFRAQWKQFLKTTTWSVFDFSLGYAALTFTAGAGLGCLPAGVLLGILHWGFTVALAAGLFRYGPRRLFHPLMLLFNGSAIGLAIFGSGQTTWVSWVSHLGHWLPPLGWILFATGISPGAGVWQSLVPCAMAGAVLAAFPVVYRKTRQDYALTETDFAEARRATLTGEAVAPLWPEWADEFAQSPAQMGSEIESRCFLSPFDWSGAGLVERAIARALTPRERALAEFLVAANPRWTFALRSFLITAVFSFLGAWLFAAQLKSSPGILVFLGAYFLIAVSVGNWRALRPIAASGLQPPFYSFHPIGFGELMRTILKINVLKYVLCVPVIVAGVILFAGSLGLGPGLTLVTGCKLALLGFFAQPIIAITSISATSTDSSRLGFAVLAVLFLLVLLAAAGGFVFATRLPLMAMCAALSAGLPVAGLLCYGRRFNRSRFDLVPAAKPDDFSGR